MKLALLSLLAVASAFAQQAKFDLADVHVSPTARNFAQNFGGVLRDGKYVNRDATMLQLIEAAYGVTEDAISGGPGWIGSDLFDVIAKVPDGTTPETAKLMLQALLADRFSLVLHNGTNPVPRYVLTVAKGGSKLKACERTGQPRMPAEAARAPAGQLPGRPRVPTQHQGCLPRPDFGRNRGQPASNGGRLLGSRRDRLDQSRRHVGL